MGSSGSGTDDDELMDVSLGTDCADVVLVTPGRKRNIHWPVEAPGYKEAFCFKAFTRALTMSAADAAKLPNAQWCSDCWVGAPASVRAEF